MAYLLVTFPCGEKFNLTFYVTPLDSSCSAILGYNWLKQYNPLIDWTSNQISFHSAEHRGLAPSTSSLEANPLPQSFVNSPMDSVDSSPSLTSDWIPEWIPEPLSTPLSTPIPESPRLTPPPISLINTAMYLRTSKLPGSIAFQLQLAPDGTFRCTAAVSELDLSLVPEEYHEFADVLNKGKADKLPPHCSYELKSEIEDGNPPQS
jgi:hypothetical protein